MQIISKKFKKVVFHFLSYPLFIFIGFLNNIPYGKKIGIDFAKFLERIGLLARYKKFFQSILEKNYCHVGAIRFNEFYFNYKKHIIYAAKYNSEINPLFIVGCMRSGTTIFANTLDLHPSICLLEGELYDVWQYLAGSPSGINGFDCKRLTAADVKEEAIVNIQRYFQNILSKNEYNQNVYALNKNPHLMNKISYVQRIFPNAKFLYIIRNIYPVSYSTWRMLVNEHYKKRKLYAYWPVDDVGNCWKFIPKLNIHSYDKNRIIPSFSGEMDKNFNIIPEAWIKLNYWALKDLESVSQDKKYIVIYEYLINNPKIMLENILHFLGLSDDAEFLMQAVNYISQNQISFPSKNPLKEWKKSLYDSHKNIINSTVEKYSPQFNYITEKIGNKCDIYINSDYSW
jgi:hypothetical protein